MGLRIKELIKNKGLTMQEVADKLSITRDTLTRNINGNPTLETLEKIAYVLNIPVKELFSDKENLYGVIVYEGQPHIIDSIDSLKDLFSLVEQKKLSKM